MLDTADREELSGMTEHIELLFARGELVLRLVALHLPLSVNDHSRNLPTGRREPFHPKDRRHRIGACPLRHGLEHQRLLRLL